MSRFDEHITVGGCGGDYDLVNSRIAVSWSKS